MLIDKGSLKYRMLEVMAYLGDAGVEFLSNNVAKGKKVYLGRKPYQSTYFSRVFKEFTTTGHIERVNINGVSALRLTPIAKTNLKQDVPLPALQKIKWDGRFRTIAYDIPEQMRYQRDFISNQIKSWGMGQYQLSLWVTAHPIENVIDDFILNNDLIDYAFRLKSQKLNIEQGKYIAEKVWKMEELEKIYLEFIGKWKEKLLDNNIGLDNYSEFQSEYFDILEKDPHLPYNLLPRGWPASEARKLFMIVCRELSK